MKRLVLLALLFSLSITTFVSAQSKPSQKEVFATTYHNTKTAIETQNYQYVGYVVYNNEKRQNLESDSNTLRIEKDQVDGKLSSLSTYAFNTKDAKRITEYTVSFNDDTQQITIQFNVGKDQFHIEIKPNGNAFLTLKSGINNITQTGKIERI